MDKYEFNIKVEQLKKMVKNGDYETAMRIADSVDWGRVHNASLLSVVSEVYEKNGEYSEAKEILLLSYERGTKGKRVLYRLTVLSLEEGNMEDAEHFYQEFYESAPEDPRNYVLRYLILRAKEAPIDQMILALEKYNSEELDEEWMYELAELYHEAGRSEECVKTCDNIMLMFGMGKYVERAIELKTVKEGMPLTEYQQGLIDNRSKYEERFRSVSEQYAENIPSEGVAEETVPGATEQPQEAAEQIREAGIQMADEKEAAEAAQEMEYPMQEEQNFANEEYIPAPEYAQEAEDELQYPEEQEFEPSYPQEEYMPENYPQNEDEEQLSREVNSIGDHAVVVEDSENDKTKILANIKAALEARERNNASYSYRSEAEESVYEIDGLEIDDLDDEEEEEIYRCAFVEVEDPEFGVKAAANKLKEIYAKLGIQNKIAKVSARKLNSKGLSALYERIAGKDLIIEEAGTLDEAVVAELVAYAENTERCLIFVDNRTNLEMLKSDFPQLYVLCYGSAPLPEASGFQAAQTASDIVIKTEEPSATETIGIKERPSKALKEEVAQELPYEVEVKEQSGEERPKPRERKIFKREVADTEQEEVKAEQVQPEAEEEYDPIMEEEMDLEAFVNYADEYARRIDCVIPGKSMNALYERAEIMEEDGIVLNRLNAEDMIEEAADKAEHPPVLRRIASIFSQKYDKKGLLILKEEHFIS